MTTSTSPNASSTPEIKRWTAKRKAAVVIDIIKGNTTVAEAARAHDFTVAEIEAWRDEFLAGGEERMRTNPRDAEARWEAEKKDLHAKIGEQSLHIDVLKKAHRICGKELPDGIS